MKIRIFIFIIISLILIGWVLYLNAKGTLNQYVNAFSIIGTIFTILAFIFALLASSRSKETRDIMINTFLHDYFMLKPEEKNIFFLFAKITCGGRRNIDRSKFIYNLENLRDSEYWLNQLIQKKWINQDKNTLSISNDRILIANNIMGHENATKSFNN